MIDENIYVEISRNGNFIRIELIGLSHESAELNWDKNWITGCVKLKAGGFSGEFNAEFMTMDFIQFQEQLEFLYNNLSENANLKTLEDQVEIKIIGDGIGHLEAECVVMDSAGFGNKLKFEIAFDQTFLPKIINQLKQITSKFPKIGELE